MEALEILAARFFPLVLIGLVTGCYNSYLIKEDLSGGQVQDTAILHIPTNQKTWGIFPVYEDILEGYLRGGIVDSEGQGIQGITVKVMDEKGKELPGFTAGVTDGAGIFRARFSLPIKWGRIDFKGSFVVDDRWEIKAPQNKFRFYFSQANGTLVYTAQEFWMDLKGAYSASEGKEAGKMEKQALPKKTEKKTSDSGSNPNKSEDAFGNFGFGD